MEGNCNYKFRREIVVTNSARNCNFMILAEKCNFTVLAETHNFTVLAGNIILQFWRKTEFLGFAGNVIS